MSLAVMLAGGVAAASASESSFAVLRNPRTSAIRLEHASGTLLIDRATVSARSAGPTVSGVSPQAGPTVGGTQVTVTGSHFQQVQEVTFGGVAGSSLRVVSSSKLRVTSPAHVGGTVDVQVVGVFGSSTIVTVDQFIYVEVSHMSSFLGIDVNVWFDGFLGSIVGGLVAFGVAFWTARVQTRVVRYQFQRDRLERAVDGLLRELPALADRTRTYSSERYSEVKVNRKDQNLAADTQREVTSRLSAFGDRPIRTSLSEVPDVFAKFSRLFDKVRLMDDADAKKALGDASVKIKSYVFEVVQLLGEDLATERGTTRRIFPPTF
jgi:hypothetical protein